MLRLDRPVLGHHRRDVGVVVQGLLRAHRPRLAGAPSGAKHRRQVYAPPMRPLLVLACLLLAVAARAEPVAGQADAALPGGAGHVARRRRRSGAPRVRRPRHRRQPRRASPPRPDRPCPGLPEPVAGRAAPGRSGSRSPARRAGSPVAAGWRRPHPTRPWPDSGSSATRPAPRPRPPSPSPAWARRAPPARRCRRSPPASTAASPPSPTTPATRRSCATWSGANGPRPRRRPRQGRSRDRRPPARRPADPPLPRPDPERRRDRRLARRRAPRRPAPRHLRGLLPSRSRQPAAAPPTCSSAARPCSPSSAPRPRPSFRPKSGSPARAAGTRSSASRPPASASPTRPPAAVRAEDACLADALAAEVARFYQRPPSAPAGTPAPPR